MKQSDEELQFNIEHGKPVEDDDHALAYRKIFETLKVEPYTLPPDFADKVLKRIKPQDDLSKDYFWLGMGILAFLGGTIVTLLRVSFKPGVGTLTFLSGYSGFLVFGIVFILLIHLLDKHLLRNAEPKNS